MTALRDTLTCTVDGCDRPYSAKGLCRMHYRRQQRNGTTDRVRLDSVVDRFWQKVHKTETCWLWAGAAGGDAEGGHYGYLNVAGKVERAHRFAYELLVGPVPDGMVLDHLCRVRLCVNPAHLEPVTDRINNLRGDRGGRTECKHGHAFTAENTIWRRGRYGYQQRECRACRRLRQRKAA